MNEVCYIRDKSGVSPARAHKEHETKANMDTDTGKELLPLIKYNLLCVFNSVVGC